MKILGRWCARKPGQASIVASSALCLSTLIASPIAYAGIGYLSRANCIGVINESVTYDRPLLRNFEGVAISTHVGFGEIDPSHQLFDAYDSTQTPDGRWRYYAGDVGDSKSMNVHGSHSWAYRDANGFVTEAGWAPTEASDCNLTEW